jgi:hypothetical protein
LLWFEPHSLAIRTARANPKRNVDVSRIELRRVEGFINLMRTLGDGHEADGTSFTPGRILNNRNGLDTWCATATAWNAYIRYYGGRFAQATGVNAGQDCIGVRVGHKVGACSNKSCYAFGAPHFELRQTGSNA